MPRPNPGSRLSPWRILGAMAIMFALGLPTLLASSAPAETPAPAVAQLDGEQEAVGTLIAAADPSPDEGAAPAAAKPARKKPSKKHTASFTTKLLPELGAIVALLLLILIVVLRLPKIELGHSKVFLRRRVMNWLPLGLTYSFLYMARYNLNKATEAFEWGTGHAPLMDTTDFAIIFMVGTITYGVSFVINGPLTDRIGGKRAILIGAGGAALANIVMGIVTIMALNAPPGDIPLTPVFAFLYAINMYFQSFGAVAIVKVNSSWFHVRERGVFGAIFGILISLGIYFAYDWGKLIVENVPLEWVFFLPAILLLVFFLLDVIFVRDTPSGAGLEDFDTADASSGDDGPRLPVAAVFKKMFTSKIIMTIAVIEFCSGFLRQAVMQFYPKYIAATSVHTDKPFIFEHWGMFLCTAGILGGMIAGIISDHVFDSRRGPVAAILYGVMLGGAVAALALFTTPAMGVIALLMSLAVIGVHGMLSGTASMDFGGRKNVGIAVGIIDGFVYLGTGLMALIYSVTLPRGADKVVPDNWISWPAVMIPMAVIGLILATRIWNAKPKAASAGH